MGMIKKEWITDSIDEKTIEASEQLGKKFKEEGLTSTQIRNFFGEVKRIQLKGFVGNKTDFFLLGPKLAYARAREKDKTKDNLKTFYESFSEALKYVSTKDHFDRFVAILEATLAYHKFNGGK